MIEPQRETERMTQDMVEACDEMHANCTKSVDAMLEATSAVTKGCEEFSRNFGAMMQKSMAHAVTTSKTLMSARSLQELGELQAGFVKEFFDSWLSHAGQLGEISTRTTRQALEPVAKHASETMTKVAEKTQQNVNHQS